MQALERIDGFFFRRISAGGFGLLRLLWGLLIFLWWLKLFPAVTYYYSNDGILPTELGHLVFRSEFRFTLLSIMTDPSSVLLLYTLLLATSLSTAIGFLPRLSTIVTFVLLLSFHERNLLPLAGGDTVLRNVGFLLVVCPELRAFSIGRLQEQWRFWKKGRTLLPPLTMSIWPYRLLLWQMILIYVASGWEKATGTMWWDGTAVAVLYHHPHFARWPMWFMDIASVTSPFISYFTLLYEFLWLALLIPESLTKRLPHLTAPGSLKRALLLGGIAFHVGIFVMADVGSFSIVMIMSYAGLMLDEDWSALRTWCNRRWKGSIAVLYDGHCGLCQRSVFVLHLLDHLQRLTLVDFHSENLRKQVAPDLTFDALDRALHIRILGEAVAKPSRTPKGRTEKGFDALRLLAWHIPTLWITLPLLSVPGSALVGRRIYSGIAARRKRCTHEVCS